MGPTKSENQQADSYYEKTPASEIISNAKFSRTLKYDDFIFSSSNQFKTDAIESCTCPKLPGHNTA